MRSSRRQRRMGGGVLALRVKLHMWIPLFLPHHVPYCILHYTRPGSAMAKVLQAELALSGIPAACCISNRCQCGCRQQSRFTSSAASANTLNNNPASPRKRDVAGPSCQCACSGALATPQPSKQTAITPFSIDIPAHRTAQILAVPLSRRDSFQRQVIPVPV